MSSDSSLPPIRFSELADALLARAGELVPAWLPGGVKRGPEWVCSGLSGGAGSSCAVNLVTGKWGDFATDAAGNDLVSLYAAIHDLPQGKAAVQVARDEGLEDVAGVRRDAQHTRTAPPPPPQPTPKQSEPEGWSTVRPVPESAPTPTFKHYHRADADIVRKSVYRLGGDVLGYVVRFRTSDGGKDDLPYTWCQSARDGACKWHWKQFDTPRPLYLPSGELSLQGRTVVLVEGERKADLLQALLDKGAPGVYLVVSWPGGCKAWAKADWSWIQGAHVLAWPDCDSKREVLTAKERNACADDAARTAAQAAKPYLAADKQPGMKAMLGIGHVLTRAHACTVQLLAIDGPGVKPDGWDAADAIETDGWDFERVIAFFATAYALPPEDGSAPAEPAAAKKIDGPVDTEGGDLPQSAAPRWLEPYWDADKQRWRLSRKLVITALRNDPELRGVLGFNELSNTMEARREWPFDHGRAGAITGATDLLLGNWLSAQYGLPSITRQALMEAMETVAYENPWHPIREWLMGLQWDGKPRVAKWLIWVIGEDPDQLTPDLAEYLALVGQYWLVGMVKRVMEPGSKFDYCPVLEGKGGLGKSTLVETLASSAWYSDTPFEIGKGKESQEQVQGVWGYELGELSQMGKAVIESIKQFISAKVDRYRPAYGRVLESHPRQCVLVGTTNENTYLRDRTGNRRFWPIPVRHPIKIEWLAKWREQLFAEAFALYANGAACSPSPEDEARLFHPAQEARLVETAVTSELLNVLTRSPTASGSGAVVNELASFVTLSQLVVALGLDAGKSNAGIEGQVRGWMTHQGWDYKKKQINGVRAWGWERPRVWPPKEADTDTPAADARPSVPPSPPPADDGPF
jgi:putative DNA primase/helicase